jgi:GTPase
MEHIETSDGGYKITSTAIAVGGSVDSGKCFVKGTLVMDYSGSLRQIEKIRPGDILMGDDSTPRKVLEIHSGKGQLYNIEPIKGQSYVVNGEHILCLKYSNTDNVSLDTSRNRYGAKYSVFIDDIPCHKIKYFAVGNREKKDVKKEADEFLKGTIENRINHGDVLEMSVNNFLKLKPHVATQLKWYRTGVNFPEKKIDLDPYMLGIWLGHGTSSKPEFTRIDKEIIEYFDEKAKNFGLKLHKNGIHYTISQIGIPKVGGNQVRNFLNDNDLINNKHIPKDYLHNSRENRLKLFAGIIDSDGYYDREKNYYEICMSAKYETLVDDAIYLIRSLGFATYKKEVMKTCTNGKDGPVECRCFRFHFGGDGQTNIPCLLQRKIAKERITKKSNMVTGITITKADVGNYYGFELDGNGRFLLGDFSVAHNSSLIGVLISKTLDDGNGSARKLVAKHPHEISSGKTSDVSTRIYDLSGSEAITLVDLCGHEDYFKTTTFGVSGHFPDYAFLIVSANRGILPMTKQHIRLLLSLSIPVLIIVTHIDLAPYDIYNSTKEGIVKTFAMYGGKTVSTVFVNDVKDLTHTEGELKKIKESASTIIVSSLTNISDGKQTIFPVLSVSNKTGFFIDVIRDVISKLKPRAFWLPGGEEAVMNNKVVKLFKNGLERQMVGSSSILPSYKEFTGGIFYIDSCYNPPGTGMVLAGINRGDAINIGDTLFMGPFGKQFYEVRVRSLHNDMRQLVPVLKDHYRGCVAFAPLKKLEIKRNQIDRGTILLSSMTLAKNICYRFKAVITIFSKSITIKAGYSPVINLYTIRQAARICKIDPVENGGNDVLCFDGKSVSVATVTFKFKQHPEFIEPYNLFVLRSSDIQGVGLVTSIIPIDEDEDAKPDFIKYKKYVKIKKAQPIFKKA